MDFQEIINQTIRIRDAVQSRKSATDSLLRLLFSFGGTSEMADTIIASDLTIQELMLGAAKQLASVTPSLNTAPTGNPFVVPVASISFNKAPFAAGDLISLDGSLSKVSGDFSLNYQWSFVGRPKGSSVSLIASNDVKSSFVADASGDYEISLVVNNGFLDSDPVSVIVSVA